MQKADETNAEYTSYHAKNTNMEVIAKGLATRPAIHESTTGPVENIKRGIYGLTQTGTITIPLSQYGVETNSSSGQYIPPAAQWLPIARVKDLAAEPGAPQQRSLAYPSTAFTIQFSLECPSIIT